MSAKEQVLGGDKTGSKRRSVDLPKEEFDLPAMQQPHPAALIERAGQAPSSLTPSDVLQLQRTIGNQAVGRLLSGVGRRSVVQAKLTVGPACDPYEQEADRVAEQVVRAGEAPVTSEAQAGNVQRSATQAPALGMNGPGEEVVQRKVLIEKKTGHGKTAVRTYSAPTYVPSSTTRQGILANWEKSPVEHKFKSEKGLKEALKRASQEQKSSGGSVPGLYCQKNLVFLTKDPSRLPTLYFKDGNRSGRIRQQHPSGPAVVEQTNKVDYFFQDEGELKALQQAAHNAKIAGKKFDPRAKWYKKAPTYTLDPTDGASHLEITYTGAPDHGLVAKTHISGGKILTDTSKYTELQISESYLRAIGKLA